MLAASRSNARAIDYEERNQRDASSLEMGLVQLPTRPVSVYTMGMRKAAIDACDTGTLRYAADLTWAAVNESGYCRGIMADLVQGLLGLPRHWTGRADMIADLDDTPERVGQFSIMFPPQELDQLLTWGISLGVVPGQMRRRWGSRPSYDYPVSLQEAADGSWRLPARPRPLGAHDTRVLRVWSPRDMRYQWWDDSYWLMTADGEVRINHLDDDTPCLDQWGRVDPLAQKGNADEWILFRPYGNSKPWERGAWKSATLAFVAERDATFDRLRHSQMLAPVRVGKVPAGTTETQRRRYAKQLETMRRMALLILPPGLEYELVESTGRVAEIYKAIIEWAERQYAMITGVLTTPTGSTGFSKGDVQERFTRGILSAFAGALMSCLHAGPISAWARDNYDSDGTDAPRPGVDTAAPEDKKARAETVKLAGDALSSIYAGAALAGKRPTAASVEKYLQTLGFEVEDIPAGEARAAKIDLAPTDKAKAFRVREVRAGEGYGPLGTLDAPDPRDDLTLAEMDALAHPNGGGAPPGGNRGDVNENAPAGAAPIAAVEESVEPPTDESAAALAQAMTDHVPPVTRCEHGRPNRCPACGVERERVLVPGTNGGEATWGVKWRPIVRGAPAAAAPLPAPEVVA